MSSLFDIYSNTGSFDGFVEASSSNNNWSIATYRTSSDTSAIDQYRQGVELTTDRHYYGGIVKIHAGYPGHQIPTVNFGQRRIKTDQTTQFKETDVFTTFSFIKKSEQYAVSSEVLAYSGSDPIVFTRTDAITSLNYDGVIEPLVIRRNIPGFKTEPFIFSHLVKGDFSAGNCDLALSSERVGQIYDPLAYGSVRYLDGKFYSLGGGGGYLSASVVTSSFRNDVQHYNANLYTDNFDSGLKYALYVMTSSDDSLIPYNQKSSGAGFVYGNQHGTDSIAFGGLSNSLLLTSSIKKL